MDIYASHYGHLSADPHSGVRRETYDEDLGQASWITAAEARDFCRLLGLGGGWAALEVACGSGGITCGIARETGATCVGVDEWHRVFRSGGQVLFTDPIVVTGQLTNEEMGVRSSIGYGRSGARRS